MFKTNPRWSFTPELNRKIDEFFSDNHDSTLTFPISFFPADGISTYTANGKNNVETELPGVSKEDLVVTYNDYDGYLIIEGKTNIRGKVKEIKKTIFIGEGVDDKLMVAELKDGILLVTFPKTEETTKNGGKTIKVH